MVHGYWYYIDVNINMDFQDIYSVFIAVRLISGYSEYGKCMGVDGIKMIRAIYNYNESDEYPTEIKLYE